MIVAPTHEETVTDMVAKMLTHIEIYLTFYQIQTKI